MQYIVYYRSKKGQSHFGGQKEAVKGLQGDVLATYNEAETTSNRRASRPQLEKAIAHCREAGATLVIARLDRLARNAGFTGRLSQEVQTGNFHFICLDNPTANENTIHILSAVAQEESQRISRRNKDAMSRLKEQGIPLGSARPNHWAGREHKRGWKKAIKAASIARSEKALREYQWLLPDIKERRERGDTMDEIVRWLNEQGKTTSAGKPFTQSSLWRIIKRHLGDEYLGNSTRKSRYSTATPERREEVLAKIVPLIKDLRGQGLTFQEIAARLNEEGHRTARGTEYSQSVIWNIAKKYIGDSVMGHCHVEPAETEGALQA